MSIEVSNSWVDNFDSPNPPDSITSRRLTTFVRFTDLDTGYRGVTLSGWVYVNSGTNSNGYGWQGPFVSQAGSLERSDNGPAPTSKMWGQVAATIAAELPTLNAAHALEALQSTREREDTKANERARISLEANQRDHVRGLEWVDAINAAGNR